MIGQTISHYRILSPQAVERFRREARAASVLNHPHICVVDDIDQHQAKTFFVMEYLEGQTLRQRIGTGTPHVTPLPLPAVPIPPCGRGICFASAALPTTIVDEKMSSQAKSLHLHQFNNK